MKSPIFINGVVVDEYEDVDENDDVDVGLESKRK